MRRFWSVRECAWVLLPRVDPLATPWACPPPVVGRLVEVVLPRQRGARPTLAGPIPRS